MKPLADRLMAKVVVDQTGCWNFDGALTNKGYGKIGAGARGEGWLLAHRAAYTCFIRPIPRGKFVLHHCDNPRCVNPQHLYVGTQQDNIRDAVRRGRHFSPWANRPGERNPNAKLTDEQTIQMRRAYVGAQTPNTPRTGPTLKELAEKYGISLTQTARIVRKQH